MNRYTDPIIQKYMDLVTSNTNVFKIIYQGEPTRIPASALPCLIISKTSTDVSHHTNVEDEHAIGLTFTVVADIRSELSTNDNDPKVVEGVARLYDIVEGRNTDLSLKDDCLLYILRNNQLVDAENNLRTDLTSASRVNYGETLQNREPAEWRIQAQIEVIANFDQLR